jgi:hypothetical protein
LRLSVDQKAITAVAAACLGDQIARGSVLGH